MAICLREAALAKTGNTAGGKRPIMPSPWGQGNRGTTPGPFAGNNHRKDQNLFFEIFVHCHLPHGWYLFSFSTYHCQLGSGGQGE